MAGGLEVSVSGDGSVAAAKLPETPATGDASLSPPLPVGAQTAAPDPAALAESAVPESAGSESAEAVSPLAGAVPSGTADDEDDDAELDREVDRRRHFMAPAMVPLARVEDDRTFCLRGDDLGDVSALATDIARLGQLFPIDVRLRPPDRFQVVTGFRRVAALRFLKRERVLVRLHTELADEDAMLLALADAIHARGTDAAALEAVRGRLVARGALTPALRDMLDKALAPDGGLGPETPFEEVDADELASDVSLRLAQCNQDLALLADVFGEIDPIRRRELLQQLRYSKELVEWLEGRP